MDNSFLSLIDSSSSILVLLPTKPYFDQVAAALALYLSLHERKPVSISCPSPMMVGFNRIIGINKITNDLGSKNLVIKFSGYKADNIEKVSYDIENDEFKLTIVPKNGFTAPQKEQLDLNYSGVASDLVILVGGANDTHFPVLATPEFANVKVLHIGTRALSTGREILSFAKPGSSTSELVANLIRENELSMDADVATDLVMGIEEGSSNFASGEVTPETFEIFAYLLRNGGQRMPRVKLSPASFPPGSIPSQPFDQKIVAGSQQQVISGDPDNTQETEQVINPPSDWLQPKVIRGSSDNNQPMVPSENKG